MGKICFNRTSAVWITWENQIRNHSMARNLGINLHEFIYKGNRICRYWHGVIKTVSLLVRLRPGIVFSQNPSVVLNVLLWSLKNVLKYKHVIDAHYVGIVAVSGSNLYQKLLDYINKNATLVIVTNRNHQDYINNIGGNSVICEDPLPNIGKIKKIVDGESKNILFICSYDTDEPYEELFNSSINLAKDGFTIYATGNYKKSKINPECYPNIIFLGYVPYESYVKCLYNSSVIVDLTTNEDCLVCGAYEAMEAEIPLVTSDTKALKEYFTAGTIHTSNNTERIYLSILFAYNNKEKLISEIQYWKRYEKVKIRERIENIKKALEI